MAKLHPTDQTLVGFAQGSLAPNEALLVSAHCDLCPRCQSKVAAVIENTADDIFNHETTTANYIDNELGNMFDAIVSRPHCEMSHEPVQTQSQLCVHGKTFSIPPSLQRLVANVGDWTQIVGKLWQAPVSIGGKNLANFIYMEKGGGVPEHTHIGNEFTLVINGQFSDGVNSYEQGDYVALNQVHTHTPISTSDDGCLVFSVIDEPLQFTSGLAKLINPLSHLYFKVSTKA